MLTISVFHVTSIEGDEIKARLVEVSGHYIADKVETYTEQEEIFVSTKVGYIAPDDRHIIPAFNQDPSPSMISFDGINQDLTFDMTKLKVGDIVLTHACSVFPRISDRSMLNLMSRKREPKVRPFSGSEMVLWPANHVRVLGNASDPLHVVSIATAALLVTDSKRVDFMELDFCHAQCLAAGHFSEEQTDEALVMAWRGQKGEIETEIIAAKGSFFFIFEEYDLDSCGCNVPEEPGLFLFTDLNYYENHDWETGLVDDCGAIGDFKTLDLAAAAKLFGSTEEDLSLIIEQTYPYLHEGDVLDAMTKEEGGLSEEKALAMQKQMGLR